MRELVSVGLGCLLVFAVGCGRSADEFEEDDVCEAAKGISPGETQTRTLDLRVERDWLKFRAEAGREYTIRAERVTASEGVSLTLHERCDGPPLQNTSRSQRAFLTWRGETDGDVYVVVQAPRPTQYDISLTSQP
jgi:hypothetical protein